MQEIKKRNTMIAAVAIIAVVAVIVVFLAGGKSKKTPIDGYTRQTTYEQIAKEYKKADIHLSDNAINVSNYKWQGMTCSIRFQFSGASKTLTRVYFYVSCKGSDGYTDKEVWETYELAEKAYRTVRDYYNLKSITSQDYKQSKSFEAFGYGEGGTVEVELGWTELTKSPVTNFSIELNY